MIALSALDLSRSLPLISLIARAGMIGPASSAGTVVPVSALLDGHERGQAGTAEIRVKVGHRSGDGELPLGCGFQRRRCDQIGVERRGRNHGET